MDRWGRRISFLQHEEGAGDSYTGRNKHLETLHILSTSCWVLPESSQRLILSWEHWKLYVKTNHKSLKIYSFTCFHSLWTPNGISELSTGSSLQQGQCQEGLTIEKLTFPVAAWIYLAYWACQSVFSSWRNRLERSENAAVFANTREVPEVQNPTCEFLHWFCNFSMSKDITLKVI